MPLVLVTPANVITCAPRRESTQSGAPDESRNTSVTTACAQVAPCDEASAITPLPDPVHGVRTRASQSACAAAVLHASASTAIPIMRPNIRFSHPSLEELERS